MQFYKAIRTKWPDMLDLAHGVTAHSRFSRGTDYYSEEPGTGYAMVSAAELADEVERIFGIRKMAHGMDITHDFIDCGVDLNVHDFYPEVWRQYSEDMGKIDLEKVTACLAWCLNLDQSAVARELRDYLEVVAPGNLVSSRAMVMLVAGPLAKRFLGKRIDERAAIDLIEAAKWMTSLKYEGWLRMAVEGMKREFTLVAGGIFRKAF
ncbi:MAG: hypothetical protein L0Y74_11260 [candidate division Zixibacteria bacterium]|nr:hypothetical protein [candidate division Zixibacteria bacterium]